MQESELVSRLKEGDGEAYEEVVRRHGGRMLAVARRMMGNEEDARDVLQDAFLRSFKSIQTFQEKAQLGTWLHRIVVTSALMKLRGSKGRRHASIDDLLPAYHADGHRVIPENPWRDADALSAERAETRQVVRDAIAQLPEIYRTVLLLRDVEQLDTKETARLLEVSEPVVKTRLHRGRQALRALLEAHYQAGSI